MKDSEPKFAVGDRVRCGDDDLKQTWGGYVGVVQDLYPHHIDRYIYTISWHAPLRTIPTDWWEGYLESADDPFVQWAREVRREAGVEE